MDPGGGGLGGATKGHVRALAPDPERGGGRRAPTVPLPREGGVTMRATTRGGGEQHSNSSDRPDAQDTYRPAPLPFSEYRRYPVPSASPLLSPPEPSLGGSPLYLNLPSRSISPPP